MRQGIDAHGYAQARALGERAAAGEAAMRALPAALAAALAAFGRVPRRPGAPAMSAPLAGGVRLAAALAAALPASGCEPAPEPLPAVLVRPAPDGLRRCAALDLHVLWLIEENAEAIDRDDDALRAAQDGLIAARGLCASGRAEEAAAVYTSVDLRPARGWWSR